MRRALIGITSLSKFLSAGLCLAAALAVAPAPASAGPLGEAMGAVGEVTAPVQAAVTETVESVATPVAPGARPPAIAPIEAPEPAAPAIAEAVKQAAEPATQILEKSTPDAGNAVAGGGEAVAKTTNPTTTIAAAPAEATAPSSPEGTGSGAPGRSDPGESTGEESLSPAEPKAAIPELNQSAAAAGNPFVYVWPAIALVARVPLRAFVERWSRAALALFREGASGSSLATAAIGRAARAKAGGPPAPPSPPPFSAGASPEGAGDSILLVLLIGIPFALLAFTVAFRFEEGEPVLPRRLSHWWRQR